MARLYISRSTGHYNGLWIQAIWPKHLPGVHSLLLQVPVLSRTVPYRPKRL